MADPRILQFIREVSLGQVWTTGNGTVEYTVDAFLQIISFDGSGSGVLLKIADTKAYIAVDEYRFIETFRRVR